MPQPFQRGFEDEGRRAFGFAVRDVGLEFLDRIRSLEIGAVLLPVEVGTEVTSIRGKFLIIFGADHVTKVAVQNGNPYT